MKIFLHPLQHRRGSDRVFSHSTLSWWSHPSIDSNLELLLCLNGHSDTFYRALLITSSSLFSFHRLKTSQRSTWCTSRSSPNYNKSAPELRFFKQRWATSVRIGRKIDQFVHQELVRFQNEFGSVAVTSECGIFRMFYYLTGSKHPKTVYQNSSVCMSTVW